MITYCNKAKICGIIAREGGSVNRRELENCGRHLPKGVTQVYCTLTKQKVNIERVEERK